MARTASRGSDRHHNERCAQSPPQTRARSTFIHGPTMPGHPPPRNTRSRAPPGSSALRDRQRRCRDARDDAHDRRCQSRRPERFAVTTDRPSLAAAESVPIVVPVLLVVTFAEPGVEREVRSRKRRRDDNDDHSKDDRPATSRLDSRVTRNRAAATSPPRPRRSLERRMPSWRMGGSSRAAAAGVGQQSRARRHDEALGGSRARILNQAARRSRPGQATARERTTPRGSGRDARPLRRVHLVHPSGLPLELL